MKLFLFCATLIIIFSTRVLAESITVVAERINEESSFSGLLGSEFKPSNLPVDFYQEVNLLPFVQSRGNSFIYSDDSMRFMGQSSSQLLVIEDGLPEQSSTGIGGSRSYHFLDPFFFSLIKTHVGGSVSSLGSGAFSGALELVSEMRPTEKYMLSVGSFGFQKMAYQKVYEKNNQLWSAEFLRSFKSGPSLKPNQKTVAENDARELNILRFKWKQKPKSELGQFIQLNLFSDYQDFDQFDEDDDRPFSKEKNFEIIYKNNQLVLNKLIWRNALRIQSNQRQVNNVFGDLENLLVYKSTNLFGKSDIEVIDFWALDNLHAGFDFSQDLYLNITEVQGLTNPTFSKKSLYANTVKKVNRNRYRASFRLEQVQKQILPTSKIGYDLITSKYLASIQFSNNTRQPSFYELYSTYGNRDLRAEKNYSLESNITYKSKHSEFQLMGFGQSMRKMIYYNSETFQFDNIHKNNLAGLGLSYKKYLGSTGLNLSTSYTYSENELAKLGLSPFKMSASVNYLFSPKLSMEWQNVFYSDRVVFGGEKTGESIFSTIALKYKMMSNIDVNASIQGDYQKNNLWNEFFQVSLTGNL